MADVFTDATLDSMAAQMAVTTDGDRIAECCNIASDDAASQHQARTAGSYAAHAGRGANMATFALICRLALLRKS